MHVPIQHIIGTVALIGLVITIGLSYQIITDYLQTDLRHQQLQQVAENVAINIVEIGNLANFGNSANGTMTRTLDLPLDLSGNAYMIGIVNDTSQGICYVNASLVINPHLSAMSILPIQSDQSIIVLKTDETGTLTGNQIVTYGPTIYGGAGQTVVWAWKGSGATWAGIGRLTGGT